MAANVRLKNEFTEDEKCHNLMTWLKQFVIYRNYTFQKTTKTVKKLEKFWNSLTFLILSKFPVRLKPVFPHFSLSDLENVSFNIHFPPDHGNPDLVT